jgi:hypothetical protein
MNKRLKINRHPVLSDNIINSAIIAINKACNTRIDNKQFFDEVTSNFCLAVLEENVLNLTFPVVATTEFAELALHVIEEIPQTNTLIYNNAFSKEIERISFEREKIV